ncbi:MAG: PAS domain S-box protein, partial [Deltaproteobacteria bacterium]|nr:PAS domain S-box protein [Deltaproteobacteria bacterium]
MAEDIVRVGAQQLSAARGDARAMTERALHMRCLAYLAQAKATLLTETIFEIDRGRRDLRAAKTRLGDTNADLLQTQQRLMTAMEQSAEGVVITDAGGNIQYANPAYVSLSGYARDELLGENPSMLRSGVQGEEFYREMWQELTAGNVWSGRFINRHADGDLWHGDATISPVRDTGGTITNYVGVIRDVSREVKLEEELRRAQKMDAIGQLAGGVAHDFNNILTAVLASVDLARVFLDAHADDLQDVAMELDTIEHCAKRAAGLTRQLLVFSRKQSPVAETIDLGALVLDVETMLRRLLRENIALEVRCPEEPVWIHMDPGYVEQVLVNLVVNARDAMPRGGALHIEVTQTELGEDYVASHVGVDAGAYVCLSVADTGVGMNAATRDRVFEPFFTTKVAGEGTGLGLSTVHGIVRQAGGHVGVYSEPGDGTSFRVYLPPAHGGQVLAEVTKGLAPPRGGDERLLVCDDDMAVREKLVAALTEAGYRVFSAG